MLYYLSILLMIILCMKIMLINVTHKAREYVNLRCHEYKLKNFSTKFYWVNILRYNSSEHYVVKYFCLEFFWHEIPERSLIEVIEAFDSNQHAIHYKQRQNKYSRHDDVSALFTGQMLSIRSLLNVLANRKMTDDNYDKRHALKYATRQYFSHSFFFSYSCYKWGSVCDLNQKALGWYGCRQGKYTPHLCIASYWLDLC